MIVAAVREELGGLVGQALGVGLLAAAVTMAEILARSRPSSVVLVGTAGAYVDGPAVGAVITARRVGLASGTATLGLGYLPVAPPVIEVVPARGLTVADVLCCLAITTDPELALRHATKWPVEHMEAYGVALACMRAGVPLTIVLGITNEVGPDAHAQWQRNRGRMQGLAAEAASRADR